MEGGTIWRKEYDGLLLQEIESSAHGILSAADGELRPMDVAEQAGE